MGKILRDNACKEFYEEYLKCTDTKKNTFSRLCNKLMNDNYIYGQKAEDRQDYYSILEYKSMLENYFSLIDYDLLHDDNYKIFFIKTNADRNRLKLKKLDTVILLILRYLYYKGSLNITSSSNITTTISDLNNELNKTGIFKSPITMTEYKNSFSMLKRFKVIDFQCTDFKEDNIILIYPTILYIVRSEDITVLQQRISSYSTNKSEEEEIDEVSED